MNSNQSGKAPPIRELPIVTGTKDLEEVCGAIAAAKFVALDTEFIRERTYFPELCLIQVATPELIACVDCLASFDLAPFFDALLRPDCTWILHSARQDLEVVWNRARRLPSALIDTQIAGALTGLKPQTSLQKLLVGTVGVAIEKDQTRADWNRRPLAEAALRYALNDVRYLLAACEVLQRQLESTGRLAWLDEECRRLLETNPEPTTATIFERTKGAGSLYGKERSAAIALVEWRERRARELDRPRRWVLSDEQLVSVARAKPQNLAELETIPDLPSRLVARTGPDLIQTIQESGVAKLDETTTRHGPEERADKAKLGAVQAQIRQIAEELGIAPEIVATRRDAVAIALGRPPEHIQSGWRSGLIDLTV
jgi:ribonuclease D